MVLCDWRWRLSFFADARRASVLSVLLVLCFIAWDAVGIMSGTFYRGSSPFMTGIELAPEFPLEELFFLFSLTYLTLNLTSLARRIIPERNTVQRKQRK